jgi:transposase
MLCWPRIRWWWSRNNRRWTVGRLHAGSDGAACVVVVAVQTMYGKAFCCAGSIEADEEDPIMTIPPELEAQILRYYHVEKWRIGTIARQLRVHPETVARVLAQAGLPRIGPSRRPSKIDPYLPFIREMLARFPTLTASRLHAMACERGYHGGPSRFRAVIACHRPRPKAEAYLRLRTLPGEEAQCDWAHFGHLVIGRARRPLMGFVLVLSFSRQIFLRFFLDARMENFLRGHLGAFAAWNGIPRVILYDNLRSVVLERQGEAIRFNPALLDFAGHYRYEPRPVAVARGNEKGRVERAIRFVRDAFFAARTFTDLDDLNAQAEAWCRDQAADRRCPEDHTRSVAEVFAEEAPRLLKQPDNPYPVVERVAVKAGKTPYVRFDLNDYSVPHSYVRHTLTVLADPDRLRIINGQAIVASHPRSFDKGQQIEDPAHVQALVAWKRRARRHRATDRLAQAAPASQILLVRAAERGANLGSITASLVLLLERYGASQLDAAITEVLERDVPHPNAVRLALERRRDDRQQAPPVALILPAHVQARDKAVRAHSLEIYDQLKKVGHEEP